MAKDPPPGFRAVEIRAPPRVDKNRQDDMLENASDLMAKLRDTPGHRNILAWQITHADGSKSGDAFRQPPLDRDGD
ncbi:MAG: hypothetical protein IPK87_14710 [Planctomycetes bacterium]|nr:hypothetical protein [Planctomycetota bacterium]